MLLTIILLTQGNQQSHIPLYDDSGYTPSRSWDVLTVDGSTNNSYVKIRGKTSSAIAQSNDIITFRTGGSTMTKPWSTINIYQSDIGGVKVVPTIEPVGFFTGAVASDVYVDADGFLRIVVVGT